MVEEKMNKFYLNIQHTAYNNKWRNIMAFRWQISGSNGIEQTRD